MKTRTELLCLLGWIAFALLLVSPVLLYLRGLLTKGWEATFKSFRFT